jgi:hypothetical protein
VEVVCGIIDNDGVACIIASRSTATEGGALGEDVDKFPFAFIAPLGAKDEGGRHIVDKWVYERNERDRVALFRSVPPSFRRSIDPQIDLILAKMNVEIAEGEIFLVGAECAAQGQGK